MKTLLMLMAYFDCKPVIPIDVVCREFFSPLTERTFLTKVNSGTIKIPLVRMELSQKAAKGVHIQDLAVFLDQRRAAAVKELEQLTDQAWWRGAENPPLYRPRGPRRSAT